MIARHTEIITQPVGTRNTGQILGQAVGQRIVHIGQALCPAKNHGNNDKCCQNPLGVSGDKLCHTAHMGNQYRMPAFFNPPVKIHNQCRQDNQSTQHAQCHALCHDNADIRTQCQCHGTHGKEAGYGGQG